MQHLCRRCIVMLRTNGGDHPCVMVTDPVKQLGKGRASILWVPLTTSEASYDPTCVFSQGEKLIMAGSCAFYAGAEVSKVHKLNAMIVRRRRALHKISHIAYKQICEGVLLSPGTAAPIRDFFLEALRQGKAG